MCGGHVPFKTRLTLAGKFTHFTSNRIVRRFIGLDSSWGVFNQLFIMDPIHVEPFGHLVIGHKFSTFFTGKCLIGVFDFRDTLVGRHLELVHIIWVQSSGLYVLAL